MRRWACWLTVAMTVARPAVAGRLLVAGPETGVPGVWELVPTDGATDDDAAVVAGCLRLTAAEPGWRTVVRQEPLPDGPWTVDCWVGSHEDDSVCPRLKLIDVNQPKNSLSISIQRTLFEVRATPPDKGTRLHFENLQKYTDGNLHWIRVVWTGEPSGLFVWIDGHGVDLPRKPPRMPHMRPAFEHQCGSPPRPGIVYSTRTQAGVPAKKDWPGRAFAGWSPALRPLGASDQWLAEIRAKALDTALPTAAHQYYLAAWVVAQSAATGQLPPDLLQAVLATTPDGEPMSWVRLAVVTAASSADPTVASWARQGVQALPLRQDLEAFPLTALAALVDPETGCRRAVKGDLRAFQGLIAVVAAGPGRPLDTIGVLGPAVFAHYGMDSRAWHAPLMPELVPEYYAVLIRYFTLEAAREPSFHGMKTRATAALRFAPTDPKLARWLVTTMADPADRLRTLLLLAEHYPAVVAPPEPGYYVETAQEAIRIAEANGSGKRYLMGLYAALAECLHLAGRDDEAREAAAKAAANLDPNPEHVTLDLIRLAQMADKMEDRTGGDTWWAYAIQSMVAMDAEAGRDPEAKLPGSNVVYLTHRLALCGRVDEAITAARSTNQRYYRDFMNRALANIAQVTAETDPLRAAELLDEQEITMAWAVETVVRKLAPLDRSRALALTERLRGARRDIVRFELLGGASDEAMATLDPVVRQELADQREKLADRSGKLPDWLQRPPGVAALAQAPLEQLWKLEPLYGPAEAWFAQQVFETVFAATGASETTVGSWLPRLSNEELHHIPWGVDLPYMLEATLESGF